MRKMPQTRRMAAQTVCHFSHNADFDQLRISKYPANAHEINYFSMLVVGSFKYTLSESGKSPACKLRSNGMPVPLLRNGYSIFNGTKYR